MGLFAFVKVLALAMLCVPMLVMASEEMKGHGKQTPTVWHSPDEKFMENRGNDIPPGSENQWEDPRVPTLNNNKGGGGDGAGDDSEFEQDDSDVNDDEATESKFRYREDEGPKGGKDRDGGNENKWLIGEQSFGRWPLNRGFGHHHHLKKHGMRGAPQSRHGGERAGSARGGHTDKKKG